MYLMIAARQCNIWPRRRVWPLQSCRELLPMASPWLLSDCAGSGRPIHIGPRLSNRPDRLDPCDMAGCQGRVAHHYWAMMTNITAHHGIIHQTVVRNDMHSMKKVLTTPGVLFCYNPIFLNYLTAMASHLVQLWHQDLLTISIQFQLFPTFSHLYASSSLHTTGSSPLSPWTSSILLLVTPTTWTGPIMRGAIAVTGRRSGQQRKGWPCSADICSNIGASVGDSRIYGALIHIVLCQHDTRMPFQFHLSTLAFAIFQPRTLFCRLSFIFCLYFTPRRVHTLQSFLPSRLLRTLFSPPTLLFTLNST